MVERTSPGPEQTEQLPFQQDAEQILDRLLEWPEKNINQEQQLEDYIKEALILPFLAALDLTILRPADTDPRETLEKIIRNNPQILGGQGAVELTIARAIKKEIQDNPGEFVDRGKHGRPAYIATLKDQSSRDLFVDRATKNITLFVQYLRDSCQFNQSRDKVTELLSRFVALFLTDPSEWAKLVAYPDSEAYPPDKPQPLIHLLTKLDPDFKKRITI